MEDLKYKPSVEIKLNKCDMTGTPCYAVKMGIEKTNTLLDSLKEYFANNTREQIEKDWKESDKFKDVGPTVKEFMENNLFCTKIKSQNLKN